MTLESLEVVRESIRELCSHDQPTWERSWRSALVDLNGGLVSLEVFHQTLAINNVILSKRTLQALGDAFSVPNGSIHAARFLHWINLSRPADYVDPELVYARLPQPFRRIVKILEGDILDAAWNIIQATSAKYRANLNAGSNEERVLKRDDEPAKETEAPSGTIKNILPGQLAPLEEITKTDPSPTKKVSTRQLTVFGALERDEQGNVTSESLEALRQSIRRACTNTQSTWEQSWKSVLSDINQVRRGLLLPDVFHQTLELNSIWLPRKTLQALIDAFRVPNGAVDANKFLKWVDMTRPNDYVDPELAFARLPQPYRRIVKIFDRDIFDAAWEMIKATSARYKAQSSAGMTARSARSSVLLLHPHHPKPSTPHEDDFTVAKKRCCNTSKSLLLGVGRGSVLFMRMHVSLPFALVGTRSLGPGGEADRIELQLLNDQSGERLSSVLVDTSVNVADPDTKTCFTATAVTDLKAAGDINSDSDLTLLIALSIEESCSSTDVTPAPLTSHIFVYAFRTVSSSKRGDLAARLLMSVSFSDLRVTCMEVSPEAMFLAIATTRNEVLLYALPDVTQHVPSSDAETSSPEEKPSPEPSRLICTTTTEKPATHMFFLNAPYTAATPPITKTTLPYAMAIVAGHSIAKVVLPTKSLSETSTALSSHIAWDHLSTISTASIDISTRFIVLGLSDGLLAVWDTLEQIDYVLLSPPSITNQMSIDLVTLHGQYYLTAFSKQAQQLLFYDISNRAAPCLIRSLTPPDMPRTSSQTVQPSCMFSISRQVPFLDVPITAVEYSNGYAMLYDVRNGEAIGSIRVPKEPPMGLLLQYSMLSNHGVVALVESSGDGLSVQSFQWSDLLNTSFPALARVLSEKGLPMTSDNVKSMYYSSVDVTVGSITLSIGGRPSLQAILNSILGKHERKLGQSASQESGTTNQISLSRLSSNNADSRTSLASGAQPSVSASSSSSSQLPPTALPSLPKVFSYPVKPTITAQFEQFCEDTLNQRSDRENKLNRRRNELLKILTATW